MHNLEKPNVNTELGYYGYHLQDPCFHGQSQEKVFKLSKTSSALKVCFILDPDQARAAVLVFPDKYLTVIAVLLNQWTSHVAGGDDCD